MGHQTLHDPIAVSPHHDAAIPATPPTTTGGGDVQWPFGIIDGIDEDDLRVTAYEIFFTACRSSPGFGGRTALNYYASDGGGGVEGGLAGTAPGSPVKASGVGMAVTSRVKTALGLKMIGLRRVQPRRNSTGTTNLNSSSLRDRHGHGHNNHGFHQHSCSSSSCSGGSPRLGATVPQHGKLKRPITSAEMMRQQMKVTEPSDNRLRKTLFRALVGQLSRRPETIILPLELLRHLKPSEFNDPHEYHFWQQRQLKLLEVGLLLYPSIPLDKSNPHAARLREIIQQTETRTIDTSKNSESMRNLCNCIVSLTWRNHEGLSNDVCHWADGFPLNVHIYTALLRSIFDLKDETLVVDEVDELLELMKKTWTTLGINRPIHNLCFTWVLFQQYVETGQVEGDLLCATVTMLNEVANDVKRTEKEVIYMQMLSSVLSSIKKWTEKRLICYHVNFHKGTVGLMENFLPLVFAATKILEEEVRGISAASPEQEKGIVKVDSAGKRVDYYIRSSLKYAFAKLLENGQINGITFEVQEVTEALMQLAKETEDLAMKEKEVFSPVLKKWHPIAAGVGAVTLHICYGTLLKQYLAGVSSLTGDAIAVLQRAGQLENVLVQMVVEDSDECEDGGKTIVREMVPYEVDSVISNLLKKWMHERLKRGKDCLQRTKETETWNPKSKTEPYAQSAVDLMKIAKETLEDFFEIPLSISDDLVRDLAYNLELLFRDYITFIASCGSKQSYLPTLPPLTRCSRDSKFSKLWRRASPCSVGVDDTTHLNGSSEANIPRPSTSRGTQRLYIRLNTLHYILSQIHSLDKTISLSPRIIPSPHNHFNNRRHIGTSSSYFEKAISGIQTATQHVSEVAAYRLIFLDSNCVFYEALYVGDVENARIRPALRILKQNLTLLTAIVTDRAQPLAMKEVMKASFDAFLTILLAGGSSRIFSRSDHEMIEEDFDGLKRVFATCGDGLIVEDVVEKEAEPVEGVVALMGQSTEQLVEDFSIVVCETSGIGIAGAGHKLPMPPTTGRWNRADPNTILRVLCYRNDRSANQFLKRTFQLAKRR
ncbi:hypothetical protein ACSBR2_030879 [Camellia fascicularis]